MSNYKTQSLQNYINLKKYTKYISNNKGFIAGGCFKNMFKGEPIRDLDIFFLNEKDYNKALKPYKKNKKYKFVYENDNCISFYSIEDKLRIELIKSKFGTPQEILDAFDFTIVKIALFYDAESNPQIIHNSDFFEHLFTNRLVIDNEIPNGVATFNRVLKYASYGYNLCLESKTKLIQEIISGNGNENDISKELYWGYD
jgi:hypothetical protein